MKTLRQLISELPTKKLVFAFGRFNPPTNGHEILIHAVDSVATKQNSPHRIYATSTQDKKKNPLSPKDKIKFMERSFHTSSIYLADSNIIDLLKDIQKEGFKEITLIVGSDRIKEFNLLLNKYNGKDYKFDKISVVSSGKRDPDSDEADGMSASKMRDAAIRGDFIAFEKGVTQKLTSTDTKRMYNAVRTGLGLRNESFIGIKLGDNEIREKYLNKEIFNIGSFVKDDKGVYEVMDRGANYITVVDKNGALSKKWLNSVVEVITENNFNKEEVSKDQIEFKGYVTKNFDQCPMATQAFKHIIAGESLKDPVAILNAIKLTDEYLGIEKTAVERGYALQSEVNKFTVIVMKVRDVIKGIDSLDNHDHYIKNHEKTMQELLNKNADPGKEDVHEQIIFTSADKIKVGRIIAGALGVDEPEKMSNPEQLVNLGLRKIRTKRVTPEFAAIVNKMLKTAKMANIAYDEKLVPSLVAKSEPVGDLEEATTSLEEKSKGLWANIQARRKAGLRKLRPGEKGYPKTLDIKDSIDVMSPIAQQSNEPESLPQYVKEFEKPQIQTPNKSPEDLEKEKEIEKPTNTPFIPKTLHTQRFRQMYESGELTAKQKVLDVDKDGKIEKDDLEKLRTKKEASINLLRRLKEAGKKTMLVVNPKKKKTGTDGVVRIPTSRWNDYRAKGYIQAEEKDSDPCWTGYKQVGMKKKDGKEVPNCVPEASSPAQQAAIAIAMKKAGKKPKE
ncbi:hypothetical protein EBU71_03190 [bacterium]|nr:hypothetical protein [Candidatus Elulimicrobium humile]